MADTLTKLEHPAVAALRDVLMAIEYLHARDKCPGSISAELGTIFPALAASAAYDDAVGECVAALRAVWGVYEGLDDVPLYAHKANLALAKIAKLGVR